MTIIQPGVIQGFHAQPVTGHKQGLLLAVPQSKGKHAPKTQHAICPPGLPRMHDNLGVTAGAKDMA